MNNMIAKHDSLQAQGYDAAARPLRTGQHAAEGGEQKCETVTERPRAALQHSGDGEVLTQVVEQQSEDSRASEGRDAAQEFPFNGDSCQPEQGTAVSVVQERGVGVGEEYTTAQERGGEGSRASEGRDAAQEKAQLEADAARAGSRNSVCEKCESEQGTAVSNDSSDEAAERPRTALQHNRKQMQPEQAAEDGSVEDEAQQETDAARAGSRNSVCGSEVEDGSVVDDGSMADAENEAAARYKATATVLAAAGKGVRSCEYTMDIG